MSGRYVLRRLTLIVVNFWIIATLVFLLFRLIPGDPAAALLDPALGADVREAMLERFGLDRPLWEQYVLYLGNLVTFEFGWSFYYNTPVSSVLTRTLPNTVVLGFASALFAYFFGIIGGVLLAWKRDTVLGNAGTVVPLFFRSAPMFWTGMVAVMVFAYQLNWLPHVGMRTPGYEAESLFGLYFSMDFLRHLILPAVVSGLYSMAVPMLLVRNSMLEIFGEEFVEFARARGFSELRVMVAHVFRNALLPVTTAVAVSVALLLGGQIVVEYVFSWPGIGREIVTATQNRDYPVAQALFLVIAGAVMIMNFLADLLYMRLDPRVRYT